MKKLFLPLLAAAAALLAGCQSAADVASHNLSKAADQFEVSRRVVFYNGITGDYMLTIEGRCSLGSATATDAVTVTCKTGPNEFKKHFLGLSDNVTYFAEQVAPVPADVYRYRVLFRPTTIVPDVDLDVPGSN